MKMGGKGKRKRKENTLDPPSFSSLLDTSIVDDLSDAQQKKRKKSLEQSLLDSELNSMETTTSNPSQSDIASFSSSSLALSNSNSNSNSNLHSDLNLNSNSTNSSSTPTSSSSSLLSSFVPLVSSTDEKSSSLNSENLLSPSPELRPSSQEGSPSTSTSSSPQSNKSRKSPKRIKMKSPLHIHKKIISLTLKHQTLSESKEVASLSTTVSSSSAFTPSSSPSMSPSAPSSPSPSSFSSSNRDPSPSPPSYTSPSSSSSSSSLLSHSSFIHSKEPTSMESFIPSKLKFPISSLNAKPSVLLEKEGIETESGASLPTTSSIESIASTTSTTTTATTTTTSSSSMMNSLDSVPTTSSSSPTLDPTSSFPDERRVKKPKKATTTKHKSKPKVKKETKSKSPSLTSSASSLMEQEFNVKNHTNDIPSPPPLSIHLNEWSLSHYSNPTSEISFDRASFSTFTTLSSGDFSNDDALSPQDPMEEPELVYESNGELFSNAPSRSRTPLFHFFNNSDLSMDAPSLDSTKRETPNESQTQLKKKAMKKEPTDPSVNSNVSMTLKRSSLRRPYHFESSSSDTSHLILRHPPLHESSSSKPVHSMEETQEREKINLHEMESDLVIQPKPKRKPLKKSKNGKKENEAHLMFKKKKDRASSLHTYGHAYDYEDENEHGHEHENPYAFEKEEVKEENNLEKRTPTYSNFSTHSYSDSYSPHSLPNPLTTTTTATTTSMASSYTKLKSDARSTLPSSFAKDYPTLLHHYECKLKDVEHLQERIDRLNMQLVDRDTTIAQLYQTVEELQACNQSLSHQISGLELDRAQHAKPVGVYSLDLNPVKLASLVQNFENGLDKFCRNLLVSVENKTRLRHEIKEAMLHWLIPVQLRQHHMARFLSGSLYRWLVQFVEHQDPLLALLEPHLSSLQSLFIESPSSTTYLREWHLHASVPTKRDPTRWSNFIHLIVDQLHTNLKSIQFQVNSEHLITLTNLVTEFTSLFHLTQAMESEFLFPTMGDPLNETIMTCDDLVDLELNELNDLVSSSSSSSSFSLSNPLDFNPAYEEKARLMEWIGCTSFSHDPNLDHPSNFSYPNPTEQQEQDTFHQQKEKETETQPDLLTTTMTSSSSSSSTATLKKKTWIPNSTSTAVLFSASPCLRTKDGFTLLKKASIFAVQRPSELDGLANVALTMDPLPVPPPSSSSSSSSFISLETQHEHQLNGDFSMQPYLKTEPEDMDEPHLDNDNDNDDIILA